MRLVLYVTRIQCLDALLMGCKQKPWYIYPAICPSCIVLIHTLSYLCYIGWYLKKKKTVHLSFGISTRTLFSAIRHTTPNTKKSWSAFGAHVFYIHPKLRIPMSIWKTPSYLLLWLSRIIYVWSLKSEIFFHPKWNYPKLFYTPKIKFTAGKRPIAMIYLRHKY